jgi:sugar phosphate isomerase/epimerase
MNKMKAGITGFIPKGADLFATLETYAGFGYRGFEGGGALLQGDVKANLSRFQSIGIKPLAIGTSILGDANPDAAELAAKAHLIDVPWVVIYHSGATAWRFADRADLPKRDEAMREIEKIDALSRALDKEGLQLVFHNHDQEFLTCYHGVPYFWLLASLVEKLKFELDLGWIHYAGVDPAKLIRQLGDRVAALHVKDYLPGENHEDKPSRRVTVPRYCAPGAGVVDLHAAFEAASETGVAWAIIEQDMQFNLTAEESVRAAYYNMKETGFVE